jgi:hypothetical protein
MSRSTTFASTGIFYPKLGFALLRTPEEFRAITEAEMVKWARVVKDARIRINERARQVLPVRYRDVRRSLAFRRVSGPSPSPCV